MAVEAAVGSEAVAAAAPANVDAVHGVPLAPLPPPGSFCPPPPFHIPDPAGSWTTLDPETSQQEPDPLLGARAKSGTCRLRLSWRGEL